ncbi:S8 family peptidase [Desulfitobacterium hafniense]|uniref:Peptidase S8/S53 domain-containing protein n=1 Tax=Desulfitobacterium hafniense (strain Y51) TaxID=138119 RepID=Q24RZ8_DESHY|nr:S8 family peptidase [Desulfitobacterium hafniense]BAE85194.1 hypothetical protein DSY3405 [Desulfitobacterium hafniense Y51]
MDNNRKSHLWIPDEEVQRLDKTLTARSKPRNISFAEHGSKLSQSLMSVKTALESVAPDNSLADADLLIFNVELPEGEKIKDKKDIFDATGMRIRAVKNTRIAIVTATASQFEALHRRVNNYGRNGTDRTRFDYIEDFKPYIGSGKNSSELAKQMSKEIPPATLDIQLMLIPNLDNSLYESALPKLIKKIADTDGRIQQEPYYLSDNTPVIRAIIPSTSLVRYENDPAIYRIEETDFFSVDASSISTVDLSALTLNESIDIGELPIVAVLDSGVAFPNGLSGIVIHHWLPVNSGGGNADHGTKVASRVSFRYIEQSLPSTIITPRARIIDCNILDGNVPVNVFIKRIQEAVETFADIAKIYNLSANASNPIEGDEMSIVGYELDVLQLRKGVQFVVSAGNHNLWQVESSLEDILDDDDSRISAPADSMLAIAVGSIVGVDHPNSLSKNNDIAPYSRRGPGFKGCSKPDLTAYAGTIILAGGQPYVPQDPYSLLLSNGGQLVPDAGTSFSAPVVSGDLAEILNEIPQRDILLAKALLYHNAIPLWDGEDMDDAELAFAHNIYGRGLPSVEGSKYSSFAKVTFVRTGILNKTTKERISIYMPEILAAQTGRNVARVSVTCLSSPPVDRTKGTEYLGAYIRASLKKSHADGMSLVPVNPGYKEGRQKWDVCQQFTKLFSQLNAGDWQIWLELFSRWEEEHLDIPYALAVTIEDVSNTLDVYSEIEVLNRYRPLNTLRIRLDNQQ